MRKTAVLFVLLALGLSSLVLVTRDSAAQDEPASSLVCPAGWDLDGEICVIDDGPQCPEDGAYSGAGICEIFPEPLSDLICPDGTRLASVIDSCLLVFGDPGAPNPCPDGYEWTSSDCRRDLGPVGDVTCPEGFSPDDSLGGMCARFEPADQLPDGCPEGARGVVDACYILVARGPAPIPCGEDEVFFGGECYTLGEPPVPGPGVCPVAADIIQDGCYRLVEPIDGECPADTERVPAEGELVECRQAVPLIPSGLVCEDGFSLVGGDCIRPADPVEPEGPTSVGPFPCEGEVIDFGDLCLVVGAAPTVDSFNCPDGDDVMGNPDDGCWVIVSAGPDGVACPIGSEPFEFEGETACRQFIAPVPGSYVCDAGYGQLDSQTCVIAANHIVELDGPQCAFNSFEDVERQCRKAVANAAGAYFCSDPAAALNGRTCVFTAPFILGGCDVGVPLLDRCVDIVDGPLEADCSEADVVPPGGRCVEVAPLSVIECPPGSEDIGAGGGCYGEVPAACEEAVEGRCLRFVAPVVRGQISGKVRNIADGSGIFGVQVCARNDFLGLESCSFSQGDGTYFLPPLPPGNYQLRAVDFSQRYENGCFGMGDCADPAWVGLGLDMERNELSIWLEPTTLAPIPPTPVPTVTVPTPVPTPVPPTPVPTPVPTVVVPTPVPSITPVPTPTIPEGDAPYLSGRIRRNGEMVDGIQVCAEPLAFFFAPACTTSGPNGAYVLDGLVSSNYYIVANAGEACYGVDSSCDSPQLFGVTPSTAISDLTIELPDLGDFECPAGYEADIDLIDCVRYEQPVQANGSVCPAGVRGVGSDCFVYVAKGPIGTPVCLQGELIGDFCVIQGADPIQPPDADFLVCPDSGFVVTNGRCVVFQPPANGDPLCPVGSVEDAAGDCRREVAAIVVPDGGLDCAAPAAELIGEICVIRYVELPEPFESCPFEFVYNTDLASCARYEAAQVADPARCPEDAFGVAGLCYDFVAKGPIPAPLVPAQCPDGSFEDQDGNCLRPLDDVVGTVGELYCATPGAVLSGDACFTLASLGTARPSEDPPACPGAYSIDDGLLGVCARFAPATDGSCPDPASALNGQSCVWAFAPWTPLAPVEPRCGPNYSIDTGLDGACARFGPADFDGEVYSCSGDGVLVSGSCIYFEIAPGGPASDADCAALNPDFPYFHEADGLCYANPIGVIE